MYNEFFKKKRCVLSKAIILAISNMTAKRVTLMDPAPPPDLSEHPEGDKVTKEMGVEDRIERNQDRGDLKKVDLSWVSVAQDKKRLTKYEVKVSNEDGKHRVEIPDEILASPTPLWEDFVIGKFLDRAPHVAKVHMVSNKIWRYGDEAAKVEVYEVNDMTMRFKVPNPKAREKILRRGMWNIIGVPMIVSKWTPTIEEEKKEDEAIPMWVHLEKIPLHMFSWEALSFITSTVGFPVKLHSETISSSNLEVAKVFVKVDVSKVLPKEITFTKEGKEFIVKFYYPWLPSRCSSCDKWGHVEKVCGTKGKGNKQTSNNKSTSVKEVEVEIVGIEETEKRSSDQKESNQIQEKEGRDLGQKIKEWSLVSPTKTGRSQTPTLQKNMEEIQISASKYSMLDVEEVEEGEMSAGEQNAMEAEENEMSDQLGRLKDDLLEDSILDQQEKVKNIAGEKKGLRGGQKAKTQDVNPMSKRSSRRKH